MPTFTSHPGLTRERIDCPAAGGAGVRYALRFRIIGPFVNLFVLLEQAALRFPRQPAVCVGTDVSFAYAELASRALRLGAGLRERHREGDRVAIVAENRPEYVELLFGIWAAGMVAVPINAKLHAREVAQIVDDAGAAAVFVSPALEAGVTDALRATTPALRAQAIGGSEYADCLRTSALQQPALVAPDALAWLFYTSGTTGRSKGAMLSHRNLLAMTIAYLADIDTVDEHASLLHAAPMSHGSGLYILPSVSYTHLTLPTKA